MTAYYNEIDPFAVQWLRCLIAMGYIADGIVDDRSISDVTPNDLKGFDQCHFFAGIGVWSHSLRLAGWPDDRPVWTGSCPCQPFSAAGVGKGFDDERHLWPHFEWLIRQCSPTIVFGEQVASKAAEPWIDLVQADLEDLGYAFGCVPFPSAGVGAPHIRDRAFWAADSINQRSQRRLSWRADAQRQNLDRHVGRNGAAGGLADTALLERKSIENINSASVQQTATSEGGVLNGLSFGGAGLCGIGHTQPSPTNGFWRDADWLFCRDGKWRPVEPGTFPLVDGASARVGRLRGYGNAINAQAAKAFIEAFIETDEAAEHIRLDLPDIFD